MNINITTNNDNESQNDNRTFEKSDNSKNPYMDSYCDSVLFMMSETLEKPTKNKLLGILTSTLDTLLMYEIAITRNRRILNNERVQLYVTRRAKNILGVAYAWHNNPALFGLGKKINDMPYQRLGLLKQPGIFTAGSRLAVDENEVREYNDIVNLTGKIVNFNFKRSLYKMEKEMLWLLRCLEQKCVDYFDEEKYMKINKNGNCISWERGNNKNYKVLFDEESGLVLNDKINHNKEDYKIEREIITTEVQVSPVYPICNEHGIFTGPVCEKCMEIYNEKNGKNVQTKGVDFRIVTTKPIEETSEDDNTIENVEVDTNNKDFNVYKDIRRKEIQRLKSLDDPSLVINKKKKKCKNKL